MSINSILTSTNLLTSFLGFPNFFGLNEAESYTFDIPNTTLQITIISCNSGLLNHAHGVTPITSTTTPDCAFAFTCDKEYFHDHGTGYYIKQNDISYVTGVKEVTIYNMSGDRTSFLEFGLLSGHRHALKALVSIKK
jgi:hypothetical protein